MASIKASWTLGFSLSPCYRIKALNVDAFRNKQNTPRNFSQPNVVIALKKNSNPSQKPYMAIAQKKNLKKRKTLFHSFTYLREGKRGLKFVM
jgi:hypothetical protein